MLCLDLAGQSGVFSQTVNFEVKDGEGERCFHGSLTIRAVDGGIFGEGYASLGGIGKVLRVDAYIKGCPPKPADLLKGILRVIS